MSLRFLAELANKPEKRSNVMSIYIIGPSGSNGIVSCQVGGAGQDAGRAVIVTALVPCASAVIPASVPVNLPADGTLSPSINFQCNGASGMACRVTVVVTSYSDMQILKRKSQILSL